MSPETPVPSTRFSPRAAREMAGMFDDVSGRYDVLNALMSLGQDAAWRRAMWRAIPEDAHRVLDLCTGSGVSLPGLRRPGRLVIGMDVSVRMLEKADEHYGGWGWAPRLVCADAFHLPLRENSLDAVTIAFGVRNLRPRREALAEMARALRPGGTLVVLEAAAPGSGAFAPFHRFYLRRVVPLLGWISHDPSAYRYLSESVFEFGSGPEFERDLAGVGFELLDRRRFLMGATRLWVLRRPVRDGQNASIRPPDVQNASQGDRSAGMPASAQERRDADWRVWVGTQLLLSTSLLAAMAYGLWFMVNSGADLPLAGWHRPLAWWLLGGGTIVFSVRTVLLLMRFLGPPPPS